MSRVARSLARSVWRGFGAVGACSWFVVASSAGCRGLAGCPLDGSACPRGPGSCLDQATHRFCRDDACGIGHEVIEDCGDTSACLINRCETITNWRGGLVCSANELPFGPSYGPLRLVDVTSDGVPDLVFMTNDGLQVARGDSKNTFSAPELVEASAGAFEAFDLDADGVSEIVTASRADAKGQTHLQLISAAADGSLLVTSLDAQASAPLLLTAADLRGTGKLDIVGVDGLRVFAVLDPRGKQTEVEVDEPTAPSAITALRNVDGKRAQLMAVEGSKLIGLRLSDTGDWSRVDLGLDAAGQSNALSVDLNRNGIDDAILLAPPGRLRVLLDAGPDGFASSNYVNLNLGEDPELAALASADVNVDGAPDLVVLRADGNLLRLLSDGHGRFPQATTEKSWQAAVRWVGDGRGLALGDAGDGHTEAFISSVPNPMRNEARWTPPGPRIVVTSEGCLNRAAE